MGTVYLEVVRIPFRRTKVRNADVFILVVSCMASGLTDYTLLEDAFSALQSPPSWIWPLSRSS